MLDICHASTLSDHGWQTLSSRTVLPHSISECVEFGECLDYWTESKRLYNRKDLKTIAILLFAGKQHACFAKDVSRIGVGFYAPLNLLPKKLVRLWLPSDKILQLSITRCRRLGPSCFECGGSYCFTEDSIEVRQPNETPNLSDPEE